METDALARVRGAFAAPEPQRGPHPNMSGVLVPLFVRNGTVQVLYTLRAEGLSSHPGEISFPGGRIEATDRGPLDAALREAHEEVGIRPQDVDVIGHLTDFVTFRGSLVCAYVGIVRADPPDKPSSPDEVAEILLVPIEELLSPQRYEGRRVAWAPERVVHYWRLQPRAMWGITGELTARFLRQAFDWTPPTPARRIESVEDFLP